MYGSERGRGGDEAQNTYPHLFRGVLSVLPPGFAGYRAADHLYRMAPEEPNITPPSSDSS